MKSPPLDVVYNSDLVIPDRTELSTLAIFYDHVLLPAADAQSSRLFVELRQSNDRFDISSFEHDAEQYLGAEGEIASWEHRFKVLFDEGVLKRLPVPTQQYSRMHRLFLGDSDVRVTKALLRSHRLWRVNFSEGERFYIRQDLLQHLLRADVAAPSVFACSDAYPSREVLKALEASAIITYFLPAVASLEPDEILAIRHKVKDTREGFALHLQALSLEVESAVSAGAAIQEIGRHARRIVETKLIPGYFEFRRQILAERNGVWAKAVEIGGKVLAIDVPPWTPRFYGLLLQALGLGLVATADRQGKQQTNQALAYRFMYLLDKSEAELSVKDAG